MTTVPVTDVSHLSTDVFKSRSLLWWAAVCLVGMEGTAFSISMASYYYVRLNYAEWPPPGHNLPGLLVPTLNVAVLIASCVPAYFASEAAIKKDVPAIRRGLFWNILLTIVALVLRVIEWRAFLFDWRAGTYGSLIWLMLGLHTFEVISALILTTVVLVMVSLGHLTDKLMGAIDFDSFAWYFLVAIWIPLYATIYLAPHVLK